MDDGLTPAGPAHLLWARREESPRPTRSGRLKGRGLKPHGTPGARQTAGEVYPAMDAKCGKRCGKT